MRILEQLATGGEIGAISVGVTDDGAFAYRVDGRQPSDEPAVAAPSYTLPTTAEPMLRA